MVRTSKSSIAPVVEKPVAEVAEVPVVEKKARKPKAQVEPVAPAPAPTPVPAPEPTNEVVAEVSAPVSTESGLTTKLHEVGSKIQQCASLLSSLKSDHKLLEKAVLKSEKLALKSSHRRKKASGTRAPSGFTKPTLITDELAAFLNKTPGTFMARTEVSKEITQYIRTHSLQSKESGRFIVPDAKLAALLRFNNGDELSYFNLQKYLKIHFVKAEAPVAV